VLLLIGILCLLLGGSAATGCTHESWRAWQCSRLRESWFADSASHR